MNRGNLHLVQRSELTALLYYLDEKESPGVLLLGAPGTGKSTLLRMAEEELKRRGRAVFFVNFRGLGDPGELSTAALGAIADSPFKDVSDIGRTLRTSAGAPPIREVAAILRDIGGQMSSPVLLFDAIDESVHPPRMAAAIEELSLNLDGWKFVVSSRTFALLIRRFARFRVIKLGGFTNEEATTLLREYAPELSDDNISRIADRSEGNPLILRILAWDLQRRSDSLAPTVDVPSLGTALERLVNEAISSSSDPAKLGVVLEELALAGGREQISALALKSRITEEEAWRLLDAPDTRIPIVLDDSAGTAALFHAAVREVILSQRILPSGLRLADLKFGAEEAERDERLFLHRLPKSFVAMPLIYALLSDCRPKTTNFASHTLRAVLGVFGGTTLNFAVGPVNLEAKLPSGSGRPSRASVDVESFLQEADSLLRESARRVAVMFDRIDETFKYDRSKQEVVVQSLLQAEGRVSLLECIELVVFLRTDLFELYDIQEKNKLVSRTLTLDWSDEEWLQVLVRRVFANEPFQGLAARLRDTDGAIETRSGLEVLFPSEIEGQPIDRWLIDSLRNGNGDISPRLAILLLYISRDLSDDPEGIVSTLPLFSAEAAGKAMTKLSDLSFSEVVNDFKVASSFVLNVRAGKLYDFSMHDVENLFNEAEGKISDQIRLLERLGFLERVVQQSGSGAKSLFRIPKLYTRCWDHS